MICIYGATETDFTHNGLGALRPFKCLVAEEINGQLELAMQHPIDDGGKWGRIEEERIIKVPTHRGNQLFRIYRAVKNPKTGYIDVNARHIFYDLSHNLLEDVRPTVKTGQEAGIIMLAGCQYTTDFTFSSDIADVSTAYYIRVNPVQAFIGNIDQTFISRWGGEIIRDNHSITINSRIGADNGVRIAYGKNLTGLDLTLDMSDVYTRILPTALNQNNVIFYTDAKYYDSPSIGNYPHPKIGILKTGIRVGQEVNGTIPYPDEASAKAAMAVMAQAAFAAGADKPNVTVNASFLKWQDTEEYKAFAGLLDVELGDDVTVQCKRLNIEVKLRVVAVEWDCIKNKANSLTLGDKAPNIAQTVVDMDIDLSALKNEISGKVKEGEAYNNVTITHEKGVVTSATISGVEIEVRQNAQEGFALYADDEYVGGIKIVNGQAVLVSNMLTNDVSHNCYAVIGQYVSGGNTHRGIFVFNNDISTTNPVFRITSYGDAGEHAIAISDVDGNDRVLIDHNGAIMFFDTYGDERIAAHQDETFLEYVGSMIGVDSGGAYYKNSGEAKSYF